MVKAVTAGDKARYLSPAMQRKIENALIVIEDAAKHGEIGIAFSGGKDSTVVLDLVRRVVPDALAAHYDSGCEYPQTYEMTKYAKAITIHPEHSLLDMCRYGGYWWYKNPVDYNKDFDFTKVLVVEPAQRFIKQYNISVMAVGLRGQESYGRRMNAKTRGCLYFHKTDNAYHLCPITHWRDEDVWAYIAGRKLKYNAIYDKMTELGIRRKEQRVSCILGMIGAGNGWRFAMLRQIDPILFNQLAAEFPMLKQFC